MLINQTVINATEGCRDDFSFWDAPSSGKLNSSPPLNTLTEDIARLTKILNHTPTAHDIEFDSCIARMLKDFIPTAHDHREVRRLITVLGHFPTIDEYYGDAILTKHLGHYPTAGEIYEYLQNEDLSDK